MQAQQPMGVRQMWNLFRAAQPNFLQSYVVYHYYRTHGWCPKAGLKYVLCCALVFLSALNDVSRTKICHVFYDCAC